MPPATPLLVFAVTFAAMGFGVALVALVVGGVLLVMGPRAPASRHGMSEPQLMEDYVRAQGLV